MPFYDIKCPECDEVEEVFHKMSEPHPDCPACGGPRDKDWTNTSAPAIHGDGYGSAPKVDFGMLGVAETRDQMNQAIAKIKEVHPHGRVQISEDTDSARQTRADEARQRHVNKLKKIGLNEKSYKNLMTEMKQLRKTDPNHPSHKKTLHELATGKKKAKKALPMGAAVVKKP